MNFSRIKVIASMMSNIGGTWTKGEKMEGARQFSEPEIHKKPRAKKFSCW